MGFRRDIYRTLSALKGATRSGPPFKVPRDKSTISAKAAGKAERLPGHTSCRNRFIAIQHRGVHQLAVAILWLGSRYKHQAWHEVAGHARHMCQVQVQHYGFDFYVHDTGVQAKVLDAFNSWGAHNN